MRLELKMARIEADGVRAEMEGMRGEMDKMKVDLALLKRADAAREAAGRRENVKIPDVGMYAPATSTAAMRSVLVQTAQTPTPAASLPPQVAGKGPTVQGMSDRDNEIGESYLYQQWASSNGLRVFRVVAR
ncbi:hypothetical protein VC83_06680 [Pseudogymnoascus destructans]|uniref:Uncharacterized protein n=1 Tax=Pseudogymnoascus destructans TaxID=655981 RepID=A0A177A5M4_9PEZI|nr:uncharacterized protein VC83_06680 [Pseudogymnoascus destructans]OAF56413.1 hypothetical protein VC83_06680 [Pseudogymnoascus destructans]